MKNVWLCAGQWMGGRHGLTRMQHSTAASATTVICINSPYPHRPKLSLLWGIRQLDRRCGTTTLGGTTSFPPTCIDYTEYSRVNYNDMLLYDNMYDSDLYIVLHNYTVQVPVFIIYCTQSNMHALTVLATHSRVCICWFLYTVHVYIHFISILHAIVFSLPIAFNLELHAALVYINKCGWKR